MVPGGERWTIGMVSQRQCVDFEYSQLMVWVLRLLDVARVCNLCDQPTFSLMGCRFPTFYVNGMSTQSRQRRIRFLSVQQTKSMLSLMNCQFSTSIDVSTSHLILVWKRDASTFSIGVNTKIEALVGNISVFCLECRWYNHLCKGRPLRY
jgi:predicted DCC family thiol-disulfide oxidoreductase YuxK